MPIEIRLEMKSGQIDYESATPGEPKGFMDYVTENVLVIECNDDDEGGVVRILNAEIDYSTLFESGKITKAKIADTIPLECGGKYIDFIGLRPILPGTQNFPLEIGQLVIQHKPTQ